MSKSKNAEHTAIIEQSISKILWKKNLGNVVIVTLVIVNLLLWLIFPPPYNNKPTFTLQAAAEILASTAMILITCGLVLSSKPRFLESYFGGLDQMYQSHKKAAISAMVLIFIHYFIVPDSNKANIGVPIGIIAFAGILITIFITLIPRIPFVGGYIHLAYHQWKFLHRFVGFFYLAAIAHSLLVDSLIHTSFILFRFLLIIYGIGVSIYLFKEFVYPRWIRYYHYVVIAVHKLNASTIEIVLEAHEEKLPFTAGQFLYIDFKHDKALAEPHPFTISSSPNENHIRLSIKNSGDWTHYLHNNLKPDYEARLIGPFGRFNFRAGGKQQIWIAGGIGITPFVSWIRDSSMHGHLIDFYYTVRADADLLFWEECVAAAQKYNDFHPSLRITSREGSLTAENIIESTQGELSNRDIFMCGPLRMMESFNRQFRRLGVPARKIHYEEFNFR